MLSRCAAAQWGVQTLATKNHVMTGNTIAVTTTPDAGRPCNFGPRTTVGGRRVGVHLRLYPWAYTPWRSGKKKTCGVNGWVGEPSGGAQSLRALLVILLATATAAAIATAATTVAATIAATRGRAFGIVTTVQIARLATGHTVAQQSEEQPD